MMDINNHYALMPMDGLIKTHCGAKVERTYARADVIVTCPSCQSLLRDKIASSEVAALSTKSAKERAFHRQTANTFREAIGCAAAA